MDSSIRMSSIGHYQDSIKSLDMNDLLELFKCLEPFLLGDSKDGNNDNDNDNADDALLRGKFDIVYQEYVKRVSEQMRNWVGNIVKRDEPCLCNSEGNIISRDPEDIMQLVEMQMEVAREHISRPSYITGVFSTCLEEIRNSMQTKLASGTLDIEGLCILANDCQNLWEHFEAMTLKMDFENGHRKEDKESCMSQCFLELCAVVTKEIAKIVVEDIKTKAMVDLCSEMWLSEETDCMEAIIATLEDYFCDLSKWLIDFFCAKCAKSCFDGVVVSYVEVALSKGRKPFSCAKKAAKILEKDRIRLKTFFLHKFEIKLKPAALRSEEQISGQLEILQAIATFLSAETPSLVTSSFIIYYRDFGHEDCVEAILETVHLRSDMTPSKLAAWGEAVAIWRKSINRAQGSIKRKNRFDLPHLQERKNEGLVFTTFAAKKELHGSDSKNIDNQTVLPAAVEKKRLKVISLT